ncbi:MAG TPA: protein kinase/lanthionine synthetase C family protein [Actinopolymorphaceae bacterium]
MPPVRLRDDTLTSLVHHQLCRETGRTWHIVADTPLHLARPEAAAFDRAGSDPPGGQRPAARLYLSATPTSVEAVYRRVVPVLARHEIAFSFAPTIASVRWLGSPECDLDEFGKCLVVHCPDEPTSRELAAELHTATEDLAGPWIPTACRWQRHSLVHTADTTGQPYPHDDLEIDAGTRLRNGVTVVRVLQADPTGGLYHATTTVGEVRVVHARRHTDVDHLGRDRRARLLDETRLMAQLADTVRVPRPVTVFARSGDLFRVQRHLAGEPFRSWIRRNAVAGTGVCLAHARAVGLRLCRLLRHVHQAGVVLRTLDPECFEITPDGELILTQLPGAAQAKCPERHRGTPGYQALELDQPAALVPADPAEDCYSLGALLFLLTTGADPVILDDAPGASGRRVPRLEDWLAQVARYNDAAAVLAPVILELLSPDPADRPDEDWAEDVLAIADSGVTRGGTAGPNLMPSGAATQLARPTSPSCDALLSDGLDHLTSTMRLDADRLWRAGAAGRRTDPRCVSHGAAGVLAVLLRAFPHEVSHTVPPSTLEAAVRKAAGWITAQTVRPDSWTDPGLYSGAAGVAWVLTDAAAALAEPRLLRLAARMAGSLPVSGRPLTLRNGLAGIALTQLRFALHAGQVRTCQSFGTGSLARAAFHIESVMPGESRPDFLERAGACAESLRAGISLHVTTRDLAGRCGEYAGIGYALLAVGAALAEPSYLDLAAEIGDALCRRAQLDTDGSAWWEGESASTIGSFLLRLCLVTGEQRFGEYARAAAGAVYRSRWASPPGVDGGLAGAGDFFLDASELLGEPMYRIWADDLVPLLGLRAGRHDGRLVVPDNSLQTVSAAYIDGLAGVLAFLLRLRRGGPRLFTLDELFTEDVSRTTYPTRHKSRAERPQLVAL